MRIDRSYKAAALVSDRKDEKVIPSGDLRYGLLIGIDGHTDDVFLGHELDWQAMFHPDQLRNGNNVQQPMIIVNDIDHREMRSALIRWHPLDGFLHGRVLTDSDKSVRHDMTRRPG